MDISDYLHDNEVFVSPDNGLLQYSGRLSRSAEGDPELIFPCSYVRFHFKGTGAAIILSSKRYYWDVYAGLIIDGEQASIRLPEDGTVRLEIGHGMVDADHVVTLFKRQDACNRFTLRGITLDAGGELRACAPKPERRIEVYGDSVSAGEVSEAVMYIAQPDPEGHEGCYSNSWYSYPWITARKLGAELHDIAQGGIALMPGTGWFSGPDYVGLEQIYDKTSYYPELDKAQQWDFSEYIPHVVIVAVGQNDANPDNFMALDYDSDKSNVWRSRYRAFILRLRELYPKARIICATTILCHDPAWDRAIEDVTAKLGDPGITHFMYSLNGRGTPGHIRIPEAEMMAQELTAYIESMGNDIWKD